MIPVALRLKNFMSYGTAAPVLDFEQFQVACLSGKNGQGKSALLDAITWSLWGEARKSSGTQKPDDELVRIGAREMQVEFVFDVEGERYRVIRSYARSATGKTSRSELELHLLESGDGDYRPLTGASMRETQAHIENVVGLDYDTFINSSFLLQGRSDEFTKKRPSERKEILARILNLGRYDVLYDLAAGRERDARKAQEQAELDIDRLKKALEPEAEWKEEFGRLHDSIEAERKRLETLRNEERCLAERLADLEARAREAAGLRQALDALLSRADRHEQDAAELKERIAQAEALIAQRDAIQRDHERHRALQQERDELDTKNELFRGIEKQLERVEAELRDRRNEHERRLDKLAVEQKSDEKQLADLQAQLVEAPAVRRSLAKALEARERAEAMGAVHEQRKALESRLKEVEQALVGKREALNGKVKALEQQILGEREALPALDALERRQAELRQAAAEHGTLQEKLEETRSNGVAVGELLHEYTGALKARHEELEQLEQQLQQLDKAHESFCPTCGTELTPAHRVEVRERFEQKIDDVRREVGLLTGRIEERKATRDGLRETYRSLQVQLAGYDGVSGALATVQEQCRRGEERRAWLAAREAELEAARRTLEAKDYAREEQAAGEDLRRQLDALAFDEAEYERIRSEAAQVARFEDRLRHLEELAGRREQLEATLERKRREAETLRRSLDDGTVLGPIQEQIRRHKKHLVDVGFDPDRFREVRQALEQLSDAGARMTALVNAQQNHAEWKQRLADVNRRAEEVRHERDEQTARLAAVEARLDEKAALEEQQQAGARACREVESLLHTLQVQSGQLREKLDKAERDRTQLRQLRAALAGAKAERSLYRHLKTAFSKHGIPSLIIEQTLPEIEDRANELLERLTDGKMHVRLETLKDKKTGGTRETLEIKITDEQGVSRPYETFSGGEAFRVNFALRIALAQLLAERNGVRIRTLVVDEGFGTQDEQGVQSLVEAIHAIQGDFEKIVVITHLAELKEVFPVRIEVEKDPVEGSCFEMMGV